MRVCFYGDRFRRGHETAPESPETLTSATNPDLRPSIGAISLRFRRRRMQRFIRELGITPRTRVLDVGGSSECWRLLARPPRVTLLNTLTDLARERGPELRVGGDACRLPFRDAAFDVVFSNSVVEHLGSRENQERFAREAARVGRGYWIQTPNRAFPLEQHLLTPFIHWLPKPWQRALAPWCSLWNVLHHVTPERRRFYISHFIKDIRLVGPAEMRLLFPGGRIIRERFCGLAKSLIAVRQVQL